MQERIEHLSRSHDLRVALVAFAVSAALWTPLPGRADNQGTATLTDANIAAIVLAANTIDIKNGELAIARTKTQAVREFARQMVTDHTSVNAKATALATKLKLAPVENAASRDLVAKTNSTRKQMRRLSGAKFDRAYVNNEVTYHEAVIDLLDKTIVPSVQNAELKDLLIAVRPAFVAHLEHAKMVQASLPK